MSTILTAIKADIGSIGGHIWPSRRMLEAIDSFVAEHHRGMPQNFHISYPCDDIAILCTHFQGTDNAEVHQLAWQAFEHGTQVAKRQGLYGAGAGQDLLIDAFAGNVKGLRPAVLFRQRHVALTVN